MIPFRTYLLCFVFLGSNTLVAAAQVMRSGMSLICIPGAACATETIDGKTFSVMQSARFTVKVAIGPTLRYNHATVVIQNRSASSIHLTPSDFRIEATEPRYIRLSYIEPARLRLPKIKMTRRDGPPPSTLTARRAGVLTASFLSGSNSGSTYTGPNFLQTTEIASAQSVRGEVYFQRKRGVGTMSLLLPVSGTIFEFPYTAAK
jgi:hypothetical protein